MEKKPIKKSTIPGCVKIKNKKEVMGNKAITGCCVAVAGSTMAGMCVLLTVTGTSLTTVTTILAFALL